MQAAGFADDAPLPLDEKCRHGKLANGLTYYIQNNKKPEARAELRLVVNIGSVYEDDDEQGLAHMVEHLAFRGTKLFDTFEVVKYLESVGAKFGACQNAYTSFDETVYEQHIPIDKEGLLEKSLTVLKEWAFYVRCSDQDVDAERSVVYEEWRQRRSAAGRSDEDYFKTLMGASKYASRLPIGKLDVIQHARPETVRGFYQKWYHPKRMAILAVGDFDSHAGGVDTVLQLIETIFNVEPPQPWREALAPAFRNDAQLKVSIFEDSEATAAGVSVDCKRPRQPVLDHKDYRRTITEHIFHEAMSARLYKLAVSDDPPFYSASTTISFPSSTMETMNLGLSVEAGNELAGLQAAITELERVRAHGFAEVEIDRAKENLLSDLEADIAEREQMESEAFCSSFVEHFCRAEPAMGVEYEVTLCRAILEEITVEAVAAVAAYYDFSKNCVVKVTRPQTGWLKSLLMQKAAAAPVSEADVKDVFARVQGSAGSLLDWKQGDCEKLEDVIRKGGEPVAGSVSATSNHEDLEAREVVLSNGMRVVYKHTRFLDDEVQFKAFAYGGLSELEKTHKEPLLSCRLSTQIASELGAFGVEPGDLVDMMSGMRITLNTDIGSYSRAFAGECSPSDMESLMQMIYLLFTCSITPRQSKVAMLLKMLREQVANQWRNPQYCFAHRVTQVNTCGSKYFDSLSVSDVDAVNIELASAFYRKCFRDPRHFTLVVVGNFDSESFGELLIKYLAAIPVPSDESEDVGSTGGFKLAPLPSTREMIKTIDVNFPKQRVEENLTMWMVDPLCCTQMTFPLKIDASQTELHESMLLGHAMQVFESRLVDKLRFELGAIYNVSAGCDFSAAHAPEGQPISGTASVSFTCQPRDVATLASVVLRELDAMKREGPTEQEVSNRAEIAKREYETSVKYNSWWLERLTTSFTIRFYNGDLSASFKHLEAMRKQVLESLAPAVVQTAFQKHFPATEHHTIVTLRPSLLTLLASGLKVNLEAVLGGRQAGLEGLVLGGGAVLALTAVVFFGLARSRRH